MSRTEAILRLMFVVFVVVVILMVIFIGVGLLVRLGAWAAGV